jgi:hypothetical protein
MKNILLSLMLLFPISGGLASAQDKPAPEKTQSVDEKIRQLIDELGADAYEVREKAHQALEKIGKPALDALRKAYKGDDLEVSSRAQDLIEKITGKKIPEDNPKKDAPSTPDRPSGEMPPNPINPDNMKDMLDKLKGFEGLSPNLKKTLDSFRKVLEGNKDGSMDLGEMGKLFEQLFNKKLPGMPGPSPDPQVVPKPDQAKSVSEIEKALGIETKPVDGVLQKHLYISPRSGAKPPVALKVGFVLEVVDKKGHAFAQGLRPYDIIIFIGTTAAPKTPMPGPYVAWDDWRGKAMPATSPQQLESLKVNKLFIEVIREGKPCKVIEMNPLPKTKGKKDRNF